MVLSINKVYIPGIETMPPTLLFIIDTCSGVKMCGTSCPMTTMSSKNNGNCLLQLFFCFLPCVCKL